MLPYQGVVLILFVLGVIFISVDLTKSAYNQCPQSKVIYKFVPRTFREEQESPISVSELFAKMFEEPTPWVGGFTLNKTLRRDLNMHFISQS
jgi:hypothetical protein